MNRKPMISCVTLIALLSLLIGIDSCDSPDQSPTDEKPSGGE
ncbi:MAG: hypothetical protein Q7S40_31555 [Opitutaceae bacterium]|nr:hypothetical protein [Opitutaceae bacterium]